MISVILISFLISLCLRPGLVSVFDHVLFSVPCNIFELYLYCVHLCFHVVLCAIIHLPLVVCSSAFLPVGLPRSFPYSSSSFRFSSASPTFSVYLQYISLPLSHPHCKFYTSGLALSLFVLGLFFLQRRCKFLLPC